MSSAAGTLLASNHLRSLVEKEETKINETMSFNNGSFLKQAGEEEGKGAVDGNKCRSDDRKDLDVIGISLKEHIEKDKIDQTQRTGWKQLVLGSILNGSTTMTDHKKESEVRVLSLAIQCPGSGRPDPVLPIPLLVSNGISKRTLFVLKEGCRCRTKFSFTVLNCVVSGLRYTYTVWKTGVRVGNTKTLVGTFSPRKEPYSHELAEETIPTGIFARGTYFVRTKFVDEDGKCYLEFSYYFEIRKNWL